MRTRYRHATLVVLTALVAAILASCKTSEDARTFGPYGVAITQKTPPALVGAQGRVYQVRTTVVVRYKTDPAQGDTVKPYSRPIRFSATDVEMELEFVVTNVGDAPAQVELLVDGFNEFWRYAPLVRLGAEGEVEADLSMVDRRLYVPPHDRVRGTISFDDFQRMAIGLAVMMNAPANTVNPFHVVEPHTDLFSDPTTQPYVPSVIDGLTGFDLALRVTIGQGDNGPPKVALESTLAIIDHGDHLVADGDVSDARPPGFLFHPVVPRTP